MREKRFVHYAVIPLILSLSVLSGCQTSSQTVGQVVGGIAGAAVGSRFGGGAGKIVAVGVGTLLGAWAGGEIAKYLSEEDKQTANNAVSQAAYSGKTISWNNPQTNVTGRATVRETQTVQKPVAVAVLKDRVSSVPPLEMIGEDYVAASSATLRGGPGGDYVKVGGLKKGETVEVIGKVKSKPWYMVAEGGVGNGFVAADQLRPASKSNATAALERKKAAFALADTARREGKVQEASVAADAKCRTIEQEIVLANGDKKTETTKACQGPSGWEIVG